jgi:hypothetical protein
MADVVLVCVRQDIERAEALAEMFDDFGFSVSDVSDDDALRWCGAGVVVWTEAAKASAELSAVVTRVMATGNGVLLNFTDTAAPEGAALCFDMTEWNGDPDDASLDRMFYALDRMMIAARASRLADWQPPAEEPVAPLHVAQLPGRSAPVPAFRALATALVVIGAVLSAGVAIGGSREQPSRAAVVRLPVEHQARVTLADVAPVGVTYDLSASPVEDAPVGRRGVEPPSAASVWRAERMPAPVRSWDRLGDRPERVTPMAFSVEPANASTTDPAADKPERDKPEGHI